MTGQSEREYMTIGELLKHYRYNHYSNPDKLKYDWKTEEEEEPLLAIKIDGTYYYIHENSLINCIYVDEELKKLLGRKVDHFSHQINMNGDKLSHSLVIITER